MTYHKIISPHLRNPDTKRLMLDKYASQEFEYLADTPWVWTEKVDGTNIRVIWDGYRVSFAGRTDRAIIPPPLLEYLNDNFGTREAETLFEQVFEDNAAVLYGEGFGPKINDGHKYADSPQFALFDVRVGDGPWLTWDNVSSVGMSLGIKTVPRFPDFLMGNTLVQMVNEFRTEKFWSFYGDFDMEGVVGYPAAGLLDRQGRRIITKIKTCDYYGLEKV